MDKKQKTTYQILKIIYIPKHMGMHFILHFDKFLGVFKEHQK